MTTFTLETNEAAFIVRVLGQLPTESGAFPLHQKLVQQFQAAESSPPPVKEDFAVGLSD
jgi:hypothetical protein